MSSIVVFNPNKRYLGAIFVQIPFFAHIRHYYPETGIILFSRNKESQLLVDLGLADELRLYKNASSIFRMWSQIFRLKPIVCYNLKPNSDLINLALGLSPARRIYGYGESLFSRLILTAWVRNNNETYKAWNYLNLFAKDKPILADAFGWFKQQPEIAVPGLAAGKTNFCFIPGGGQEIKRWGIINYLQCGQLLLDRFPDAHLVFIMGTGEKVYLPEIEQALHPEQYTILLNRDVATICTAVRMCKLTIANDCGPSHIAQMLGGAYLGVWGYARRKSLPGRLAEWSIPRENAIHIAPPNDADIKTMTPKEVFQKAMTLIQF